MNTLSPLHSLFSSRPSATHHICHDGERYIDWSAFRDQLAGITDAIQPRVEKRWLIAVDAPHHFSLLFFALLHAGKQVVIPPNRQAGTLAQLSENAYDAIADEACLNIAPSSTPLAPLDPETAVIDLYTSGSTGAPKQVRKHLRQLENEVATLESLWGKQLRDTHIIATVPHHHIYGLLFRILWPLSTGRTFDAVTCTYPDILNERLGFFKKAVLISSPAHLSRLPTLLPLDRLAVKPHMIFSSGGPLSASAATELAQAFDAFPIEVFGSTETGGIAWRTQDNNDAWTLMPNSRITQDENGQPQLHSPYLPDEKSWQMDDAVDMLSDGRFKLGGRLDRIVKVEEKRLSLPDMEALLLASPLIQEAATTVVNGRRQTVGAAIVLSETGKAWLHAQGRKKLLAHLRGHLANAYEPVLLPKQWRLVEALPLNERGKLAQQELTALFAKAPEISGDAILYPEILRVTHDKENTVSLAMRIPHTLTHFEGHFPELPILPGVVQVDWAIHYARQHLNLTGRFKSVEQLRFQSIVQPEAQLLLALEFNPAKNTLTFAFTHAQRHFSSGRIVFGEAA